MYLNIFQDIGNALNDFKDGVLGFFNTIADLIGYVVDFFKQLLDAINYLWQSKSLLTDFVSTLPSWLSVFAIATISILILFRILNRSGG